MFAAQVFQNQFYPVNYGERIEQQLATITVTEETVMFDGKETKALVSSYLNGTLDREVVTVWVVSGNTLAAVGGFPEDVWDVISRMTFGEYRFS